MFEYQLKLSRRRKTVSIKVTEKVVIVSAPYNVCESALSNWLKTKQTWVVKQKLKLKQVAKKQTPTSSNSLLVFGNRYHIQFDEVLVASICHKSKCVYVPNDLLSDKVGLRSVLINLLSSLLERYLDNHLNQFASVMDCKIKSYKIREYKSRWGSCSSKQTLTFNCLLAGAPKEIIDYVIVHELAHCHIMSHSLQFWTRVETFYPKYKSAKAWFKTHGTELMIE